MRKVITFHVMIYYFQCYLNIFLNLHFAQLLFQICVWWEREGSELFAWAPIVKAEDRANILIYPASTSGRADLLACHYTEHNPFSVLFSVKDPSQLRVTELLSTARVCVKNYYTLLTRISITTFVSDYFSGSLERQLFNFQHPATIKIDSTEATENSSSS